MRRAVASVLVTALAWAAPWGVVAGAQDAPPPTPVPPHGSPSPYPTVLQTPEPSTTPPRLSAPAAALADLDSGEILFVRGAGQRRAIASTTKIMTALLVLESSRPSDIVTASAEAASQRGARLGLETGERIPVRELLFALMLQSSNDAATALAEHVSGTVEDFVDRMNRRAHRLGLRSTRFASPNGLDDRGYSTARDLVAITAAAYRHPVFAEVARTRFRAISDPEGGERRIQNRNALLWLYQGAIGVKTGFTAAAGFCLVAAAERDGLRLVSVVLGSRQEAFSDSGALLNFGFAAFEHRTVVREGQSFEPVRIGGRTVQVVAGRDLRVLLRRESPVATAIHLRPGLALPLARGERVGQVVVLADGEELGRVGLVTVEAIRPIPPPAPIPPWWRRAWEAAVGFLGSVFRALIDPPGLPAAGAHL